MTRSLPQLAVALVLAFVPALVLVTVGAHRLPCVTAQAVPATPAVHDPAALCRQFRRFDLDGDGTPEILELRAVASTGTRDAQRPRVVALCEERLWAAAELRERLRRWADDLAREAVAVDVLAVQVHRGAEQDGRTTLALRGVLQAWRASSPGLRGAVLVGHFPDAFLVRTVNWRKHTGLVVHQGTPREQSWQKVRYLRRVPEIVAPRCDLVLMDLDGPWEAVYRAPETELPSVVAVFPDGVPAGGGMPVALQERRIRFHDFFHVDDGRCEVAEDGRVVLDDDARDAECTDADRALGNPIARPEIFVSRIDARGVAWSPHSSWRGQPLVDADGRPVRVADPDRAALDGDFWRPDPQLELDLLVAYFDRNHSWRTDRNAAAHRPASIAHGLPSGMAVLRRADPAWRGFDEAGYDLHKGVDLVDLCEWLRRPASLRTLRSHSDPLAAVFDCTDEVRLRELLAGPLAWRHVDGEWRPAIAPSAAGGRADWAFWCACWRAGLAGEAPFLLLHTGCEALSPPGAARFAYDDERYDRWAHGESVLFFTAAVAVVGRAKVFYDEPRGFTDALAEGAGVGDALRRYPELEASTSWGAAGGDIGRKRSYFWSILGDGTLRLR